MHSFYSFYCNYFYIFPQALTPVSINGTRFTNILNKLEAKQYSKTIQGHTLSKSQKGHSLTQLVARSEGGGGVQSL